MLLQPRLQIHLTWEVSASPQLRNYPFIPLLWSQILTAQSSHVNRNTANTLTLESIHGSHPQARLAHLPTVEDVAKLTRLQFLVQFLVCLAFYIAGGVNSQTPTNKKNKNKKKG